MLTLKAIGSGQRAAEYYCEYCQDNGEAQGVWLGRGAEALGIEGSRVGKAQMEAALQGFSPLDGKTALCFKPGPDHRGGWDLTFSPDKSVSIVWANASPELRKEIERAQEKAVLVGVDYLERQAAWTRTGKGGVNRESSHLLVARFQHSSNRAGEAQLHTHTVVFNVARTVADDKWRTVEARDIFRKQRTASALYKAELAAEFQKLGFQVEKTKDSFRVVGVPEKVCEAQSSRARAIDDALREAGLDRDTASARAKEIVALSTRKAKGETLRPFERWQEESAAAGFSVAEVDAIRAPGRKNPFSSKEREEVGAKALQELTGDRSTFEEHELVRKLAEASIGRASVKEISELQSEVFRSGAVLAVGSRGYEEHFTTATMFDIERELVRLSEKRQGEHLHDLPEKTVSKVVAEHRAEMARQGKTLHAEQENAVRVATQDGNGVSFICGVAGAGKTSTSKIIREAFDREGFHVVGIAPTNKAAQELSKDLGIETTSIHKFLADAERGEAQVDRKTVVFIDEGAMVDSKKTLLLNKILAENEAKAIYLGDAAQIQPIEAGQAFGTQYAKFKGAELSQVNRQSDKTEAAAILAVRNGRTQDCLSYVEGAGRLHLTEDRKQLLDSVLDRWVAFRQAEPEASTLIVASKNKTVDATNSMVHEKLRASGELLEGQKFKTGRGEIEVSVGERLLFTGNKKRAGICRSQLVTVTSVEGGRIVAKTDFGKEIVFNPREFNKFTYGYCMTANRSQGATVDRSFVIADGGFMDRERFYVALSRGRRGNEVFADKLTLGGLSDSDRQALSVLPTAERGQAERSVFVERLAESLNRSGAKITTQDFTPTQVTAQAAEKPMSREALKEAWASLRIGLQRSQSEEKGQKSIVENAMRP